MTIIILLSGVYAFHLPFFLIHGRADIDLTQPSNSCWITEEVPAVVCRPDRSPCMHCINCNLHIRFADGTNKCRKAALLFNKRIMSTFFLAKEETSPCPSRRLS